MFAIEVEYLMGRAYAGSRENRQAPEFPPPPARLHSALVSAFHRAGLEDDVRQALLWLEQQPPPAIAAGRAVPRVESGTARYGRVPTTFVPHNYPRNQCGREILPWLRHYLGRTPRHFPSMSLERDRVHFIWQANAPVAVRRALAELVEYVGYLGTSSSKVRVAVCDSPPRPEFEPCGDEEVAGELVLSVPYCGRLASLEKAYRANRQAPSGRPVYYRSVMDKLAQPVQSEFDELFILRPIGRTALPARHTVFYTSALRDALLRTADGLGLKLSAIHGHDNTPHCAFLALPHTGHPHAESTIKAFSIAFPCSIDAEERNELRRAAQQISELRCGRYGDCGLAVPTDRPTARTADPSTWVGPSRKWTTVTPILLDRFPKDRRGESVAEVVSRSCTRIGLPTPISVEFGAYSSEPGVQPVQEFLTQRKPDDHPRLARHVTLHFPQEVRGPVLLGAGRYFGLGLCKPLRSTEEQP